MKTILFATFICFSFAGTISAQDTTIHSHNSNAIVDNHDPYSDRVDYSPHEGHPAGYLEESYNDPGAKKPTHNVSGTRTRLHQAQAPRPMPREIIVMNEKITFIQLPYGGPSDGNFYGDEKLYWYAHGHELKYDLALGTWFLIYTIDEKSSGLLQLQITEDLAKNIAGGNIASLLVSEGKIIE